MDKDEDDGRCMPGTGTESGMVWDGGGVGGRVMALLYPHCVALFTTGDSLNYVVQ